MNLKTFFFLTEKVFKIETSEKAAGQGELTDLHYGLVHTGYKMLRASPLSSNHAAIV